MHLSAAARAAQLDRRKTLRTLTPSSLRSPKELERDLAAARRRGWAVAREESHAGLTAVGAAILDGSGCPVAGISLSDFDHPRVPEETHPHLRPHVTYALTLEEWRAR